ncbi:MAG: hypothetical protein GKR96_07165 [Gammaproteobacteria bacterium]|nr:hypothetical protein [Gammaproteobacteria bacterium]
MFQYFGNLLQSWGMVLIEVGGESAGTQIGLAIGMVGIAVMLFAWIRKTAIGSIKKQNDKISHLEKSIQSYRSSNKELENKNESLKKQLNEHSMEYISLQVNKDIEDHNIERAVEKTVEQFFYFSLHFETIILFTASFYAGKYADGDRDLRKAVLFNQLAELVSFDDKERKKRRELSESLVRFAVSLKKDWRIKEGAELLDAHSELEGTYSLANYGALSQRYSEAWEQGEYFLCEMIARRLIVVARRSEQVEAELSSKHRLAAAFRLLGEYQNAKTLFQEVLDDSIKCRSSDLS